VRPSPPPPSQTEQAYAGWVVRFVRFHRLRHKRGKGAQEVAAVLTWLAVERRVAASTQGQAQAAPVSLNREVLGRPLRLAGIVPRARGPPRPAAFPDWTAGRAIE
jgi:hypothetical protein